MLTIEEKVLEGMKSANYSSKMAQELRSSVLGALHIAVPIKFYLSAPITITGSFVLESPLTFGRYRMKEIPCMSAKVFACTPRLLPRSEWTAAAKNAIHVNPANRPPDLDDHHFQMSEEGERLAMDISRYWGSAGVHLTVGFIETHDKGLRRHILEHMNAWGEAANVEFIEADLDPQVRIARWTALESPGDEGYWSNLGTDVLLIPPNRPTMNLEAFTLNTPESEFIRVVRHETGHTLGFPHEHMRQELIDRLDRKKVIAAFMANQGWSYQEVLDQVLTPLEESSVLGTYNADQTSIMCYQIDGDLTKDRHPILGGTDINELDYAFAASVYPKPKE